MFKLIRKIEDLNSWHASNSKAIGLVPTMGNLHVGHLSLVNKSLNENSVTLVTIFVNPKQFGPNEDFAEYPRTLERDCELLKEELDKFSGKELVVFAPASTDEIYPDGFSTIISVNGISEILCGADRPGHFDGVTTVVHRLFNISKASTAYFGQKDYQQVKVIQRMVLDMGLQIDIKTLPISRDEDGLARSSRNQYLTTEARQMALTLPKTLSQIEKLLTSDSWLNSGVEINKILETSLSDKRWNYLEIKDANNLNEVTPNTNKVVILGAFKVDKTRLIDNRLVKINYA
ncbi:MAG: pantoate--beta-alanine ligase [Bacteriovorax sp. MedPE-SWde]|nr:MAG: pantoate--beta-alanine ligase [Bacteriovorax sp. MedPE-SWde]